MITADVSCRLLEVDFSGIESVLTGYRQRHISVEHARDYIRLSRLGVHAAVTALAVGKPADLTWPDDQLKTYLTEIKSAHPWEYDCSKRCIAAGARVPIDGHGWIPIEEVQPGMTTGDQRIAARLDNGVRDCVTIETVLGRQVTVTPDHMIYTARGWRPAQDLVAGDLLTVTAPYVESVEQQHPWGGCMDRDFLPAATVSVRVDRDWGAFLGMLYGDGSIQPKAVSWLCSQQDADVVEYFDALIARLGLRADPRVTQSKSWKLEHRRIHSVRLARFLRSLGITNKNGREFAAPDVIFRSPTAVRGAFLRGLFECDGTISGGRLSMTSRSKAFARDVVLLLQSLNIYARWEVCYNTTYKRDYYRVAVLAKHLARFQAAVGFIGSRKRAQLDARIGRVNGSGKQIDHTVDTVVSVTPAGSRQVYDLSMAAAPHAFYADGIYVHNCVHGNNYGLTTHGMHERFPDIYKTLKDAERFQQFYYGLCPALPVQHRELRKQAREKGFLGGPGNPKAPSQWDHEYGYRHWFWDVLSYQPCDEFQARKWLLDPKLRFRVVQLHGRWFKMKPGGDWNRVIAFYPQSMAAGRLKEAQRRLFLPWSDDYIGDCYFGRTPLLGPIHDSLLLHIPVRCWDRVVATVARVMQEPSTYFPCPAGLNVGPYLPIGVSAKAGRNWAPQLTAEQIAKIQAKAAAKGKPVPVLEANLTGMEDIQIPKWVAHAGPDDPVLPREEDEMDDWRALARVVAA